MEKRDRPFLVEKKEAKNIYFSDARTIRPYVIETPTKHLTPRLSLTRPVIFSQPSRPKVTFFSANVLSPQETTSRKSCTECTRNGSKPKPLVSVQSPVHFLLRRFSDYTIRFHSSPIGGPKTSLIFGKSVASKSITKLPSFTTTAKSR